MRNLAIFPVTHEEIIQWLTRYYEQEIIDIVPGSMGATLLGSAILIVKRDKDTALAIDNIIAAMRNSSENIPDCFIEQLEEIRPKQDFLGMPL